MEKLTLKQVIDKAMEYNQRKINTALPCKIIKFDEVTQLADVQVMIDRIGADDVAIPIPVIHDIPVLQPYSGKIAITMPIEEGDTGQLIFNQRNIDTFIVEGIKNIPFDKRIHDIQDAVVIVGLGTQKKVLSDYDTDGMSIRSEDNKTHIQVKQDGTVNIDSGSTTIKVEKDGSVTINTSSLEITGDVNVTGNINATGDILAGTTSLKTHTHIAGTLLDSVGSPVSGITGIPAV